MKKVAEWERQLGVGSKPRAENRRVEVGSSTISILIMGLRIRKFSEEIEFNGNASEERLIEQMKE